MTGASFVIAQYCSEVAELLTPYDAENQQKYELLSRTWELLGVSRRPWRIFTAFVLRFLKLSGYSFVEYLKSEENSLTDYEIEIIRKIATMLGLEVDSCLEIKPGVEDGITQPPAQFDTLTSTCPGPFQ